MYVHCIQNKIALEQNNNILEFCLYANTATTGCKNVETLRGKTDLSYFKLLLVTMSVKYNTHRHLKLFLQVLNKVLYC